MVKIISRLISNRGTYLCTATHARSPVEEPFWVTWAQTRKVCACLCARSLFALAAAPLCFRASGGRCRDGEVTRGEKEASAAPERRPGEAKSWDWLSLSGGESAAVCKCKSVRLHVRACVIHYSCWGKWKEASGRGPTGRRYRLSQKVEQEREKHTHTHNLNEGLCEGFLFSRFWILKYYN